MSRWTQYPNSQLDDSTTISPGLDTPDDDDAQSVRTLPNPYQQTESTAVTSPGPSAYNPYWMQVYRNRSPSPVSIVDPEAFQQSSARAERRRSNRLSRTSAHVDLDYFDREGVEALRRRMSSRISQTTTPVHDVDFHDPTAIELRRRTMTPPIEPEANEEPHSPGKLPSSNSEVTLSVPQNGFNFEKTLRAVFRKYVMYSQR
jgi:hypothetical protein